MLAEIILVILAILFVIVAFKMLKKFWPLIINSVIALVILMLLNGILKVGVAVNLWSILIVAIGGLPGLVLVVLLHILGIAF